MKWIRDGDAARIQEARKQLWFGDEEAAANADVLLAEVLDNIHALAQEQPHPEPRIVELSEAEMRRIYPERFTQ